MQRGSPSSASAGDPLVRRLARLGAELAQREAASRSDRQEVERRAAALHDRVSIALDAYHAAVEAADAPQLRVTLSPPRADDKHLHAVEFDLRRGRYTAIVTVKLRGEITLVGPFRAGKPEGPCKSFPFAAAAELDAALADFLEEFLREAASP